MTPSTASSNTTDRTATACVLETIIGFLLPFFLTAAGGNVDTARAAIRQLIDAYGAATATELDLAGRIVGFSIAALDNLRLSMGADLPVTKVLRYRSNAVTLGRASDQARKALAAIRANPDQPLKTPRPSVAPAPLARAPLAPPQAAPSSAAGSAATRPAAAQTTPAPTPAASAAASIPLAKPAPSATAHGVAKIAATDIEAMKQDARLLLNEFSKHGAPSLTCMPTIADPATMARDAARAAIAAASRPNSRNPAA